MQLAILGKDGAIKNLQTISEDLSSYVPVSSLENLVYKGQDISEVAKKPRTLKAFLSRAQ